MKQFKTAVLLIIACITLCACPRIEEGHRYTIFVNKSESEIVCQALSWGNITNADTLFQCRTGAVGIPANSSHNFSSLDNSGWEADFKLIPYLQFSVMDAETYDKYITEPCDTIRKYVPILHTYRLSLSDLQRMNWTVVYPPEE